MTNYERTHKATTRQSVWNGFYWQSKIRPPICAPFGTKSYILWLSFFQAKVDGESDVTKLHQLFKITQAVMVNRHNMVEESMAEAEEEAKKAKKKGELFKVS